MATTNPHIPTVRNGLLRRHDEAVICRVGRNTGWLDWLQRRTTKSFHFVGDSGQHCTVCKERRVGGSGTVHFYFIAYRSIGGKKRRISLGRPEKVTLLALEKAAGRLAQLHLEHTQREKQSQTSAASANSRRLSAASPKRWAQPQFFDVH